MKYITSQLENAIHGRDVLSTKLWKTKAETDTTVSTLPREINGLNIIKTYGPNKDKEYCGEDEGENQGVLKNWQKL